MPIVTLPVVDRVARRLPPSVSRLAVLFVASTLWGCAGAKNVSEGTGVAVTNAWGPAREARTEQTRRPAATGSPSRVNAPARPVTVTSCAEPLAETEPLYTLPYAVGDAFYLRQGTCGPVTHRGRFAFAYDFDMPRGTQVLAARDGVVSAVVDGHPEDTNRSSHANYVMIRHEDGEQSRYLHLATGGARVAVGDSVRAGDVIAVSGNSGRSVTPHLHFDVVGACDGSDGCPTLPATFLNAEVPAPRAGRTYVAAEQ